MFYERNGAHVFYYMEESIAWYKTIGSQDVAGDLNSRTSDRFDYIQTTKTVYISDLASENISQTKPSCYDIK